MKAKVVAIHTAMSTVEIIKKEFIILFPNIDIVNVVNEGLLTWAIENNGAINNKFAAFYYSHIRIADELKADAILSVCSSVGDAAKTATKLTDIPIYRIDEPMMSEAVDIGNKIGLIATFPSTLDPSGRLIEEMAKKRNKKVIVNKYVCENALRVLNEENDRAMFESIVQETVETAAKENNVIVLAQASMYQLKPLLAHIKCPVLSSLPSGIEQMKSLLTMQS